MSVKTKILSLFLLAILFLPVIVGPKNSGSVLGVIENRVNPENVTNNLNNKVTIGEIGSGAFETKSAQSNSTRGKIFTGKAIWEDNAKTQVVTDKFSLGKGLKVSYKNIDQNLVVGDVRVLSEDTLLVLNKDTFIELGGNPEKENSIEVSVISD